MALHLGSFRWIRLRKRSESKRSARNSTLAQRLRWSSSIEALEPRAMFAAGAYRSIDGIGNNLAHPEWGSTDEQLLRMAPAEYGDGISTPAGADRLSGREISNALAAHAEEDTPNDRNLTAYIYVWGQFLDHDLDLTKGGSPAEQFNIAVPTGDPSFDPNGTGTQVIPLVRSVFDPATGTSTTNPRQQINQVTAWIDGSMIYGSDATRAAALRTFVGGKLKVIETPVGDLPALNTAGLPNNNDAHRVTNDQLFLAGDVRANENIELTSMHTLFVREHNRLADQIAAANPSLSDEEIYQRARAKVIAELQVITYKEWLPALLGPGALRSYRGYNPNVNPQIANEFSTAAFRLHSTINDDVEFFDNEGRPITFTYTDDYGVPTTVEGEIALFEAFSNPTMFKQTGVDGILKYAASTHMEALDNQLVESLRNFLFGQPGQGGLDLASLNIQRGRDHGLADYNAVRVAYGLPVVQDFDDITSDPELQQVLEEVYGNVNNIDLWVGGLAEDHVPGSTVGPLIQRVLANQFERLRDGDRFWYQRVFSGDELWRLERTTLADIIERNTGVDGLQDNVFFFRAEVRGQVFFDRNGDGDQDRFEFGMAGIRVELLSEEGEVIAATLTGRDGRYRFTQFGETGDFQVRIVVPSRYTSTGANPAEVLISTGDQVVRGVNFGLRERRSGSRLFDSFADTMTPV
jgi:peroxidase